MRRALLVVGLIALFVAGCGSSKSPASSPLNTELSYYPTSAPFVLSVMTDPGSSAVKNAQALVRRFPIATFGESALTAKLDQLGIDYQGDIKPLLGNPLMLGTVGATLSNANAGSTFLVVWVTKDSSKLNALLKKIPGLTKSGSHDGATLYQAGGTATYAVDGATILLGPSAAVVDSALDRHANGGGITTSQYSHAFTGLPQDALIQTFGSLTGVLSQPSAAKARQVPWVAAIRGYAASVSANSTGLTFSYRLDTSGRSLTEDQVPITTGTTPPNLVNMLPIAVGVRNPAHIFAFIEAVEQTTSPSGWAKFEKRQAAIRARTGVDLTSLLKLATGSLIIASDTHLTAGRAEVSDPSAAASTLSKLVTLPSALLGKATRVSKLGGGFYAIKEKRSTTIDIGIVGNQLVAGKATPAQLRAFAAAPTAPAAGAQGSLVFRVGLAQLLALAIKHAPSKVASTILSSLGDVTGWTAASPSALTGSATLAVH
jgi:Protein of unknown function (DUF3352)